MNSIHYSNIIADRLIIFQIHEISLTMFDKIETLPLNRQFNLPLYTLLPPVVLKFFNRIAVWNSALDQNSPLFNVKALSRWVIKCKHLIFSTFDFFNEKGTRS